MKNPIKNLLLCAAAAAGLFTAGSASAVSILNFTGSADFDQNLGTPGFPVTAITEFYSAVTPALVNDKLEVESRDGIFLPLLPGTTFTANSTLTFGSPDPFVLFQFGAYSFTLTSSLIDFQNENFFNASGSGFISGPGINAPATLLLTSQDGLVDGHYSISGSIRTPADSINVPEGGSAIMFLGLGLVGVESLRRRLMVQA